MRNPENQARQLLNQLRSFLVQSNISPGSIDRDSTKSEIDFVLSSTFFKKFLVFSDLIVAVVDNTTLQYPYMSDSVRNILGFSPEDFYREGVQATFRIVAPRDIERMLGLTEKFYALLLSHPPEERLAFRITYDLEVYDAFGSAKRLIQEMIPMANDKEGKPYLHLLILSDITRFKSGTHMNWKISRFQNNSYHVLESGVLGDGYATPLTRRETEIIRLLGDGFTTTKIAGALFISEETVRKHRKNILHKTKASNVAELMCIAAANGWI